MKRKTLYASPSKQSAGRVIEQKHATAPCTPGWFPVQDTAIDAAKLRETFSAAAELYRL